VSRRRPETPRKPSKKNAPFHAPFGALAHLRPKVPVATPPVARTARSRSAERADGPLRPPLADADPESDDVSFRAAMADVRPLAPDSRIDAPPPALALRRAPVSEEAEALAALSDLVSGAAAFDVSDSMEYLEGAVVGLDPRILRRLRAGEFAYQAYLDGLSTAAARPAVEAFISRAFLDGHRCVLIVHGRGRNSKDNVPILKERLKSWLAHGRIGRAVLAFTSARPADGGTGAVYVLLRRRRGGKEPIAVYEGAKRE
jgi:DNA-nicking Smr family endonuclease